VFDGLLDMLCHLGRSKNIFEKQKYFYCGKTGFPKTRSLEAYGQMS
jgi:hypothetical protein